MTLVSSAIFLVVNFDHIFTSDLLDYSQIIAIIMGNRIGMLAGRIITPVFGAWVVREASINIHRETNEHKVNKTLHGSAYLIQQF